MPRAQLYCKHGCGFHSTDVSEVKQHEEYDGFQTLMCPAKWSKSVTDALIYDYYVKGIGRE